MSRNHERELTQALVQYLRGLTFTTYNNVPLAFTYVAVGRYPERAPGFPIAVVAPLGPLWSNSVLGAGSRLQRINRQVQTAIEVHYEHLDAETGLYHMSDIFTQLVESLLGQPRLLDEEVLQIIDTDYSYAITDKQSQNELDADNLPDWGYKGVAVVVLEATWRYNA